MQELVILKNKEAVTTSLQVAESFEKASTCFKRY